MASPGLDESLQGDAKPMFTPEQAAEIVAVLAKEMGATVPVHRLNLLYPAPNAGSVHFEGSHPDYTWGRDHDNEIQSFVLMAGCPEPNDHLGSSAATAQKASATSSRGESPAQTEALPSCTTTGSTRSPPGPNPGRGRLHWRSRGGAGGCRGRGRWRSTKGRGNR